MQIVRKCLVNFLETKSPRPGEGAWKSIHSHWSFTSHPALQAMTVETSERIADSE
jgi:hypothetical protein